MSCETSIQTQDVKLTVEMGSLPEGFCPANYQELANAIAQRMLVTFSQKFTSFAIGAVAPTSNVGPWLKNCTEWYVWNDTTGQYEAMEFPTVASVGAGTILAWAGTIATIPDGYLFCDGSEVNIADYPNLYAVIGTQYGTPACPDVKFTLPDLRNKFIVGADADVAGVAKTTVTGAPLQDGGAADNTQSHGHTGSISGTGNSTQTGTGGDNCLCYPDCPVTVTVSPTSITVPTVPPFQAHPWIIKT